MCTDKKKKEKLKGKAGRKQKLIKKRKKNLLLPKYAEEHLKP